MRTKLSANGNEIFSELASLAKQTGALDASRAQDGFAVPSSLEELVARHFRPENYGYADAAGISALREAVVNKVNRLYGHRYDAESESIITSGVSQAIFTVISTFVKEGDEVVVFEPAYQTYVRAIEQNGGRAIFVPLKKPNYQIDWEEVQKLINARTKLIVINTPHMLTGNIFSDEDMLQLQKIVNGTKIMVLCDESFKHLVYDKEQHASIAGYEKLAEHSILVTSFGKIFNIPGWKVGYCLAPAELMKAIRKTHVFQSFTVVKPLQLCLADLIDDFDSYRQLAQGYQEQRDRLLAGLKDSPFTYVPSGGSYYQLLNYEGHSEEKDIDFVMRLMEEQGIATIPLSVFYHDKTDNKSIAVCFANDNERIDKIAKALQQA